MSSAKILLCAAIIFSVAFSGGCGSAVKTAVKETGKTVAKTAKKVPLKDEAVGLAVDAATGDNTPQGNRTSPTKPPVAKRGMVMAGGAVVASEIISNEKLNANDLSLGGLSIDDRASKIQSVLGDPKKITTDSDGAKRLHFNDVEVVLRNGKISALVSLSSAFSTPRGIHEGSSLDEVLAKYGDYHQKISYDGMMLYEYLITSFDGTPCYLRFAINESGRVTYISERFVQ